MRKNTRRSLVTVLIVLVCVFLAALGWIFYDTTVDRSGFVEKNGVTCYQDFHARLVTGWQDIDGSRYYFGDDYAMATGWQEIGGNRYHFGDDGAMDTFWQQVGTDLYYLGSDGIPVTGWQDINGTHYYFRDDGTIVVGWVELDGSRYHLGDNGAMSLGFYHEEGSTYYLGDDGVMVTGHVTLNGEQYFFQDNGIMYTGWEQTENGTRYYLPEGPMAFGWTEIGGKRYRFDDSGLMQTGWLEEGEYRYYLQEDGSAAVGPTEIGGDTYYFTPKGIQVVLVNRLNPVPDYYALNLVTVTEWHQVSDVCLEPLKQMLADCQAAGNNYTFNSAHRTIEEQTMILEARTEEYLESFYGDRDKARAKALETVAVPGTSEHHLGLAVDILGEKAIAWLTEHCWEYGFIVRYTKEKENITGIVDEPWHFRYVGVEVSMDMKDSGLCLEEYLGAEAIPLVGNTNATTESEED